MVLVIGGAFIAVLGLVMVAVVHSSRVPHWVSYTGIVVFGIGYIIVKLSV